MTLCLAVLCRQDATKNQPSMVLVVADQLITEGGTDEQHEAPQLKAIHIRPQITAFLADNLDSGQRVCRGVLREINAQPSDSIEFVVRLFSEQVAETLRAICDEKLLRYGTTLDALLAGTDGLGQSVRNRLLRDFRGLTLDACFLVVGVDVTGAHIWIVYGDGSTSCQDPWSFGAIGSGHDLARRRLKQVGYQWSWLPAEALTVAYMAKRDAEMDAWVGDKKTSITAITRDQRFEANADEKRALEENHTAYVQAVEFALATAKTGAMHIADSLLAPRPPRPFPGQEAALQSPPASTDGP